MDQLPLRDYAVVFMRKVRPSKISKYTHTCFMRALDFFVDGCFIHDDVRLTTGIVNGGSPAETRAA